MSYNKETIIEICQDKTESSGEGILISELIEKLESLERRGRNWVNIELDVFVPEEDDDLNDLEVTARLIVETNTDKPATPNQWADLPI